MKSILQSIKPQRCELIASGRMKINVMKTRPKIQEPFKVYIYCAIGQRIPNGFGGVSEALKQPLWKLRNGTVVNYLDGETMDVFQCKKLNGKVIGEYVCDEIQELRFDALEQCYLMRKARGANLDKEFMSGTCLSYKEAYEYCKNLKCNSEHTDMFYGWHISDLKIYDKPKELSEFMIIDKDKLSCCPYRERIFQNPEFTNSNYLYGGYSCSKTKEPDFDDIDFCRGGCTDVFKPLTRPPQSWCYVEE